MRRISSAEFVRNFSAVGDDALNEAIVLTRNGRDRLVVLNVEEYRRLARLAVAGAGSVEEAGLVSAKELLLPDGHRS